MLNMVPKDQLKKKCPEITSDNSSIPCNSIWNNLTRRKTLVEY